jgi:alkanesulfonate monooxygenase SsuD/methylene tetrahydromethanopterin reductase-like flavin-dependent oxidoreductase (luciferase family)
MVADAGADPWWDRLPTTNWVEQGPIKPLSGSPEDIAQKLLEFHAEGITHIQICLEPTTPKAAEAFAPVLNLLRDARGDAG